MRWIKDDGTPILAPNRTKVVPRNNSNGRRLWQRAEAVSRNEAYGLAMAIACEMAKEYDRPEIDKVYAGPSCILQESKSNA